MKIFRIIGRAAFVFLAITYTVCLMNGITVIDYTATDDRGTLTVAGRTIEVHNRIADVFLKTYTRVEDQAEKWLPQKIKNAVGHISDIFD